MIETVLLSPQKFHYLLFRRGIVLKIVGQDLTLLPEFRAGIEHRNDLLIDVGKILTQEGIAQKPDELPLPCKFVLNML